MPRTRIAPLSSEAQAALATIEREASIATERLERVTAEEAGWSRRAGDARAQSAAIATRIGDTERELAGLADIPARIEDKRKALLSAIADAEEARKRAADALALAESELKTTEHALRAVEEKLNECRELRARLEAQSEAAAERGHEIAGQIHDVLACAPEDAFAETGFKLREDLPDLEATEARLERYRRERENLGGVNLRAEEEANEAQTRLDDLSREKADLEGAIHKLRAGIISLNREGRERILAAFDKVNEHFERLFTTLFEGGTAKLEMVESDDPLEAGLEIMARPPGKRLTTLSLLSGGEQALTAMSLIFAVFLSNPAPICVLDEVDAPLDDANVDRFCNLLYGDGAHDRHALHGHHPPPGDHVAHGPALWRHHGRARRLPAGLGRSDRRRRPARRRLRLSPLTGEGKQWSGWRCRFDALDQDAAGAAEIAESQRRLKGLSPAAHCLTSVWATLMVAPI